MLSQVYHLIHFHRRNTLIKRQQNQHHRSPSRALLYFLIKFPPTQVTTILLFNNIMQFYLFLCFCINRIISCILFFSSNIVFEIDPNYYMQLEFINSSCRSRTALCVHTTLDPFYCHQQARRQFQFGYIIMSAVLNSLVGIFR